MGDWTSVCRPYTAISSEPSLGGRQKTIPHCQIDLVDSFHTHSQGCVDLRYFHNELIKPTRVLRTQIKHGGNVLSGVLPIYVNIVNL